MENKYKTIKTKTVIIGAGPAGLFTAISYRKNLHNPEAKGNHDDIIIIDGSSKPGLKLLITGGGRCNITNAKLDINGYYGESKNSIKKVISQFNPKRVIDTFTEMGVSSYIEEQTNKYFPKSNSAKTILNALLKEIENFNIQINSRVRANNVEYDNEKHCWITETSAGIYISEKLVICSGGLSYPKTGSSGELWSVLKNFGIKIKPPVPALTSLKTSNAAMHKLAGITVNAKITIRNENGKIVQQELNPVLLTHNGLSGPGIFNISHYFTGYYEEQKYSLELSFIPEYNGDDFQKVIIKYAASNPNKKLSSFLSRLMPRNLSDFIIQSSKIRDKILNQLSKNDRKLLLNHLFHFNPDIVSFHGFNKAEITAGGILLNQLDLNTMEFRDYPGLYACGEIVNVQGIVGGYNLQWAWSSAWVCGLGLCQ